MSRQTSTRSVTSRASRMDPDVRPFTYEDNTFDKRTSISFDEDLDTNENWSMWRMIATATLIVAILIGLSMWAKYSRERQMLEHSDQSQAISANDKYLGTPPTTPCSGEQCHGFVRRGARETSVDSSTPYASIDLE